MPGAARDHQAWARQTRREHGHHSGKPNFCMDGCDVCHATTASTASERAAHPHGPREPTPTRRSRGARGLLCGPPTTRKDRWMGRGKRINMNSVQSVGNTGTTGKHPSNRKPGVRLRRVACQLFDAQARSQSTRTTQSPLTRPHVCRPNTTERTTPPQALRHASVWRHRVAPHLLR